MLFNNLNLIRAEFVIADATMEECDDILRELDSFTGVSHPAYPQHASYSGHSDPSVKTTQIKFSVLYNEDDEEAFDRLFFKLQLKYPDFSKMLTSRTYSMKG